MKLSELGERLIIKELEPEPGDDCSLIESGNSYYLISSDLITRKTHIPDGASYDLAGKFFATINLSDIAAMAGRPIGIMVSYSVNPDLDIRDLKAFHDGIKKQMNRFNAKILGGDTKEGEDFTVSGTIIGIQEGSLVRRRSDIKPGQKVYVTNDIGRSSSGFLFYKNNYKRDLGISLMMNVEPRINEAIKISQSGAMFMMDLSDGLAASFYQIRNDYKTGFKIYYERIPKSMYVREASKISGVDEKEIILSGGGDYELLFSVPYDTSEAFERSMSLNNINVSCIGETYDGANIINMDGSWEELRSHGYEHFLKEPF
ncbi:thiamine-phosphate kinase [Picrophilus oshimae]|uniref:Thiamine-monophosphate kinase n=1 Tax=Picrophilus torridus (strain ATCC 700027 / DSM 9790 / JCM 10055 / NBRC 100828 / KAW 2/3) TaxID=1122961 RepID=Q6L0S9_PICTO|nr:thiamine-phosphate kinase [Picrophilus oshimae]AAT43423.1 thiamine-monophosphate kinase [Picrophilus oshimae DSM 9789]